MSINSAAAFSKNVRTLLAVTGLKSTQFADLCGLPQPRISEIVAGRYGKNLETVDRICEGFNRHYGEEIIRPESLIAEHFELPAKIFSETG